MFFFGVQVVAFVVIIFWYTWVVGLVVLVVVPLLMLIVKMLGGKMATAQLAYTRQRASTRGVVMQGVAGLSILNILRKGLYYCGIFRREMAPEYRLYAKQVKVGVASQTLNNAIAGLLPIAFAALTALLYVNSIVDNVGTIVLVYMLTTFLVYPIQNTGQVLQEREVGHKAYTRIAPLMEERIDNFGDKVLDGDIHTVEIDIERYAYDEDKSILQGFGLSLRAGDSVCVVGESGSGKSTLLKLLLNQIHADTARIQINGNNLKDIERESYYRQVGYVQQKSFMFRGSVIDNITLGDSYTQEEIDRVLQECGLREFVDTYGLDKEIDEKNENVSGGQLQRISLARTLIRRPKLILLDEPTASLDSETGVDIVKTLLHRVERDNLILLCVSHDKSVIELFGKKIEIG
jgi:ABC-type bacteriocin/lantibiotic exporter with double-glycine peptidase domain